MQSSYSVTDFRETRSISQVEAYNGRFHASSQISKTMGAIKMLILINTVFWCLTLNTENKDERQPVKWE